VRPCRGQDAFQVLHLHCHESVATWPENETRVFVAEGEATLRQGRSRLVASGMVLWLEQERTEDGTPQAVVVRAYAEGTPEKADGRARPVVLVAADGVRRHAAAFVEFRSEVSFSADCHLEKLDGPRGSPLLARALSVAERCSTPAFLETLPRVEERGPFEIITQAFRAEQVQIFWDDSTAVFIGDVQGSYGNLTVRADEAVLWYDTEGEVYEIYACGNVRLGAATDAPVPDAGELEDVADVLQVLRSAAADELYINPTRARGLAVNAELRAADPDAPEDIVYVFRGDEAFLVDSRTLEVHNASVTTCRFARPHYRIFAPRAQIVSDPPSTFLTTWSPRFQVGESQRTLLVLPFLGTDLTHGAYLLTDWAVGASDKYGVFGQTTWRPLHVLSEPPSWIGDWTVDLDYYSERGPGAGTELDYRIDQGYGRYHEGLLRGYYVQDLGEEDDTGLPVPRDDRGRFHLQHRWQYDPALRFDAEYYGLSDAGFLREYFEDDYEEEKPPESYLLARYLEGSTYLALLAKKQVNSFLTQTEETPGGDLQFLGVPLWRFVYDGSATAGRYEQRVSDLLPPAPPYPPELDRAHTEHRLSLPFSLSVFRLDPFVKALATWADAGAYDGTSYDHSEDRTGAGGGMTLSTTFSRVFGTFSDLFDLNRLRHVVMPYAGIESIRTSGSTSFEFVQLDRIDTIDDGTVGTVGLRQRLQTKRRQEDGWQTVDWLDLDVAYVGRSSDSVLTTLDEDYVTAHFDMQLSENVSIHSHDNRIGLDNLPDVANAGASFDVLPRWRCSIDYDYVEDISSAVTADLFCELSDRYQLLLYQQYELDSGGTGQEQNLETRAVVRRLLDQWVLDMGVRYRKANRDVAFIVGFGPKGWNLFGGGRRAM
jgi:hypothetical protein